ncbi:MAG: adenosylhomocysteinase [Planctomycetes bacterium]|nr:adenosylhomocysteinase [Planctomycetota bacterium]
MTQIKSSNFKYDVADLSLSIQGKAKIEWAAKRMPVLAQIASRFRKEKPLKGITVSACLHVTTETANLCTTLQEGGASVNLCASNPLSTQDDTAASLVSNFRIPVFAKRGIDTNGFYKHLNFSLDYKPNITLDDGGDLINLIHTKRLDLMKTLIASLEETTTGINRLRAMDKDGALKVPVFAVNDAYTKFLFDNRYGTGQSTVDGIIRATNVLLAGKNFVVCGYGWCGKGLASRARGLGAKVVICEVNPIRALEAVMDGFQVMKLTEASRIGDIFCTVTGNKHIVRKEHFQNMKDGAILCNSGHFDVEIDIPTLIELAKETKKNVRPNVDSYILKDGKAISLIGHGRLVNLAAAEGHPSEVMDMSFATQALSVEYAVKNQKKLRPGVHNVPAELEDWIANLKLKTFGVDIDTMTSEQKKYSQNWKEGT